MRSWARLGAAVVALAACSTPSSPAPPSRSAVADASPRRAKPRPDQITPAQLWHSSTAVVVHESPLRVERRLAAHPRACAWPPERDRVEITGLDVSRLAGPPLRLGEIVSFVEVPSECDYDGCVEPPPSAPEVTRAPETQLAGAPTLLVHEAPGRPTLYVYADGTLGWDIVRHARLRPDQVETLVAFVDAIGPEADVPIDGTTGPVDAPTVLRSRGGLRRVLLDGREAALLALALDAIERQLAASVSTYLRSAARRPAAIVEWTGAVPLATLVPGARVDAAAATARVPPRLYQTIRGASAATRYFRDRGLLYQVTSVASRFDYASLRVEPCVDAGSAPRTASTSCFVWPATSRLRLADTLVPGGLPVPPDAVEQVTNAALDGRYILQNGQLYYGIGIDRVERGQVSPHVFDRRRLRNEDDDRTFAEAFARISAGPHDRALRRLAAVCATLPSCAGACSAAYAAFGRGVAVDKAFGRCAGAISEADRGQHRRVALVDRVGASLHDFADDVARVRPELGPLLTPEKLAGWLPPPSISLYGAAPCADVVTLPIVF